MINNQINKTDKIPAEVKYYIDQPYYGMKPNYAFMKKQIKTVWPHLSGEAEYQTLIHLAKRFNLLTPRVDKWTTFATYYLHRQPLKIQKRFNEWMTINTGTIAAKLNNNEITIKDFYNWIIGRFETDSTNKYFGRIELRSRSSKSNSNDGDGGVHWPKKPLQNRR